jgi:hypothetical protein
MLQALSGMHQRRELCPIQMVCATPSTTGENSNINAGQYSDLEVQCATGLKRKIAGRCMAHTNGASNTLIMGYQNQRTPVPSPCTGPHLGVLNTPQQSDIQRDKAQSTQRSLLVQHSCVNANQGGICCPYTLLDFNGTDNCCADQTLPLLSGNQGACQMPCWAHPALPHTFLVAQLAGTPCHLQNCSVALLLL